ncbi:NAD(P)-binding protein [Trichoderma citrinoviride]|uniref:NAD(P)-binding protein n=1 Tax=Trichoderma citrinoviride TaxID=58853 RepID=A0A2T4B170_9HYPO|nr:NAD(P)-binding protein [Trichoderma citrinoviride]PTB63077.1 NAD(P)-binding protein [Trichoderma citrinoviride]
MNINGNAFIIGGGSGIGRACALGLAKDGAIGILIADMNIEAATRAAAECRAAATAASFRAESCQVDVSQEESVIKTTSHMVATFGRIDYCINCAGIGVQFARPIAEADFDEFSRFLRIHVEGTFLLLRSVSKTMQFQELKPIDADSPGRGGTRGSIVTLGSGNSFAAAPDLVQYTTAKHAVLGVTKNAALDNASHGIRVNCVCPTWVETPMVQNARDGGVDIDSWVKGMVPLGRIATAEEVADAVIFLCLRRTVRHITGHNAEGKGVFIQTDCGDHHRVIGNEQALANIIYSTKDTPVEMNGDVDLKFAKENEPPLHIHNGSVCRMIDFAPDVISPMHRAVSLDYGIVIEGEFKLILDSGESRIMRQGDVSVQRASAHQWHNITGGGTLPGRMMWVLLDCKPIIINGQELKEELNELQPYYEGR